MEKYTTESGKGYSHFTLAEREEIAIGLERGENKTGIAKKLGRHKSSIGREIKRNNAPFNVVKYRANRAQIRADERKQQSRQRDRLSNPIVRLYVEYHLVNDGWTPEAIAGRLPLDMSGLQFISIKIMEYAPASSNRSGSLRRFRSWKSTRDREKRGSASWPDNGAVRLPFPLKCLTIGKS